MKRVRNIVHRVLRPGTPPVWNGFAPVAELDRARLARDLALAQPETRYAMFFTPRSGSSWVCDLVTRSRRLGVLGESFNPNFLPDMTRAMNAATLDDYIEVLQRRRARNGVFGFQITHHQLTAVFGSDAAFLDRFADWHHIWLIRRDIVLQAVSLYKMEVTSLAHAPHATAEQIRAAESRFVYDPDRIRRWLDHILAAELATEALIARAGLAPLRMSYEHNITLKPNHLLNVMGRHMGLETMRMKAITSSHSKIATGLNEEFANRFRRDTAGYLARVDDQRAPMLENLVYYGPRLRGQGAGSARKLP